MMSTPAAAAASFEATIDAATIEAGPSEFVLGPDVTLQTSTPVLLELHALELAVNWTRMDSADVIPGWSGPGGSFYTLQRGYDSDDDRYHDVEVTLVRSNPVAALLVHVDGEVHAVAEGSHGSWAMTSWAIGLDPDGTRRTTGRSRDLTHVETVDDLVLELDDASTTWRGRGQAWIWGYDVVVAGPDGVTRYASGSWSDDGGTAAADVGSHDQLVRLTFDVDDASLSAFGANISAAATEATAELRTLKLDEARGRLPIGDGFVLEDESVQLGGSFDASFVGTDGDRIRSDVVGALDVVTVDGAMTFVQRAPAAAAWPTWAWVAILVMVAVASWWLAAIGTHLRAAKDWLRWRSALRDVRRLSPEDVVFHFERVAAEAPIGAPIRVLLGIARLEAGHEALATPLLLEAPPARLQRLSVENVRVRDFLDRLDRVRGAGRN